MERVISAFPSLGRSFHTARSWEFIASVEGLFGPQKHELQSKGRYGEGIIVGMLDSGIWPESKSFSDKGLGPVPSYWRGICQEGDAFNSSHCNNKIIGARYYLKAYTGSYGPLNTSHAYRSPRDHDGHGTHTASTVAGRVVPRISFPGGFANGTASGGVPLARLAIYKVCWPIPGNLINEKTCFDADMLAAIDDAIDDGVHIISISIGTNEKEPSNYAEDGIALGALHAAKSNIVVVCSAGNAGPSPATVSNLAPWIITVGASSIDRAFDSPVVLGSGMVLQGKTVTPTKLEKKLYPLVYAGDVEVSNTPSSSSGQCMPNSLDSDKVKGKVVLCMKGVGLRFEKGLEVKRAGGAAILLGTPVPIGNLIAVDANIIPGTALSSEDVNAVLKYINYTDDDPRTVLDVSPAPVMAQFSGRGPNRLEPNILKPDITAPGLNILAAWSEASSPTKLDQDLRRVKYNLMSGTSMACPHVAATAALLRSLYPNWSAAAIRSAIMTTAKLTNTRGGLLANSDGEPAGPMDFGSGHVRPTHAADPGLVYYASYIDYLLFACSAGGGGQLDISFPCPSTPMAPSNLNYPSLAISGINDTTVVRRTVTNVGHGWAIYSLSVIEPAGISVDISPKVLFFTRVGQKKTFLITLKPRGNERGMGSQVCAAGSYTWSDGVHFVRSPIVVSDM